VSNKKVTAASIKSLMTAAFEDNLIGSKTTERGSQRAICAVMYAVEDLAKTTGFNFTLGAAAREKEVLKSVTASMAEYFGVAAPDTEEMDDDETTEARSEYQRRSMQVVMATKRAAFMQLQDIYVESFDVSKGLFSVPAHTLFPSDGIAMGRLLNEDPIMLDRRPITYKSPIPTDRSKMKTRDKYASVAHFMTINGPVKTPRAAKAPGTPSPAADTSVKFTNAEDVATRVPLATMIEALHTLLLGDGTTRNAMLTRDALTDKEWNMMTDIITKVEESRASWTLAEQVKQVKAA
jgi:hypothetical protein